MIATYKQKEQAVAVSPLTARRGFTLAARLLGRLQSACERAATERYYYDDIPSRDALVGELCDRMADGEAWRDILRDPRTLQHGERIPEYTYVFEQLRTDRPAALLDVGCVLNNATFDGRIPQECEVSFLNPASEPISRSRANYHRRGLWDFGGQQYPFVTCLSTLEHIGFDNTRYGTDLRDEGWDWSRAISCIVNGVERLTHLVAPAGTLVVSCPYGRREYVHLPPHAGPRVWQVLHADHVAALQDRAALRTLDLVVLRLGAKGWEETTHDATFAPYGAIGPGASGVILMRWQQPLSS